jgi:uncharacterized protein (TIGR03435 family)
MPKRFMLQPDTPSSIPVRNFILSGAPCGFIARGAAEGPATCLHPHLNKIVIMSDFCNMLLSTEARQLVRDETGLQGKYDFQLRWSRDPEDLPSKNDVSIDAAEIFTAVKEQLGLQMVPRRVSEKVLVIDHIERPTPD